ncbi:MAG TPA: type II secretion system protein [Candidatus Acidoferrum sp.]|nr:type II secretion system protein [Candidatus Acidoferrum sp.]
MKRDNRGFSLVEVMAGIMILGIIMSPLLHSFVTAARTAAKSRRMHNATLAARSLIETVDAYGIDQIVQDIYVTGSSSLSGLAADAGLYTESGGAYHRLDPDDIGELGVREPEYVLGVKNMRLSDTGQTCDAVVRLDASDFAQNTYPVANYTTMDSVYLQPKEADDNPDYDKAARFADEAMLLWTENPSLPIRDTEYFFYHKSRSITINIEKVPDYAGAHSGYVIASAEISYTADYEGYPLSEDPYEVPYYNEFTRTPYDEDAGDLGIESLYFFYYPNYGSGADTITILNEGNLPIDIFLVKQIQPNYFGSPTIEGDISSWELSHSVSVILKESADGSHKPVADMHTNLLTNIITQDDMSPTVCAYKVIKGGWYSEPTIPGTLIDMTPRNRLYAVSVELFEPGGGASFEPGESILDMDATSIE